MFFGVVSSRSWSFRNETLQLLRLQRLPKGVVGGHRCCGADELVGNGMHQFHMARVQSNASVGQTARRAILQVASDGHPNRCKLAAYLVVATCHETNFQQLVMVGGDQGAVEQDGFFGPRNLPLIRSCTVLLLVSGEPMAQLDPSLCVGWRLMDGRKSTCFAWHDGPIGLVHLSGAEHLVQT